MSIQTASLNFSFNDQGVFATIKTPTGAVTFQMPPPSQFNWNQTLIGAWQPVAVMEPRPKAISKKRQKRMSVAQEHEVMEGLGGRRHPGSGAVVGLKGDGRVRNKYRVETKMTSRASYSLTRKDLSKIRGECSDTERPLLVLDFVDPDTKGAPDRWVVVEWDYFRKMDLHAPSFDLGPRQT